MENTVIGVYDSYTQADNALNELLASGFSRDEARLTSGATGEGQPPGAQEGHAHESGIGHFFRSLFGMDEHPDHHDIYSEALQRGSCVLSVNAADDERRDRAVEIMNRYDPVDLDERAAHWRSQGWSGRTEPAAAAASTPDGERNRYVAGTAGTGPDSGQPPQAGAPTGAAAATGAAATAGTETARFPVVEEQLKVGKREVQSGGVRVYQRVTQTPVEQSVPVREEHLNVERHAVDQPASEADLAAFKEGSVELREMAEEPVVSKTARVVEEVVVDKDVSQRNANVSDTVRKTDVEVEPLGAARANRDIDDTAATAEDADFRDHWRNVYGQSGQRYEDYDAAYRYGAGLGGSERFRNYRWSDVEGDVRNDWQTQHPESDWERVKEAVRYGAERGTPGQQH
jgi:uncharacterized protein (TIGR02271 family)